jgi:hypothetical protein
VPPPCRQPGHDDRPHANGDQHGEDNATDLAGLALDAIGRVETKLDLRQDVLDLCDANLSLLKSDHNAPLIGGSLS